MKYPNKYPIAFLLSFTTITLTYLIYGLYIEGAEKFGASVLYGNICSPPTTYSWIMDPWLFHVPILAFLSSAFENTPVLGIWHLIIQVVYLSAWLHLAIRIANRIWKNSPFFSTAIGYLIIVVVIGTSLIYFYNLRDAILLTSSGLLLSLDYYIYENKKPTQYLILFFLGCVMRLIGGLLVLLAITILFVLYTREIKKTFHLLKFHWLAVVACLLILEGYKHVENNPAMKIEQGYEYALLDRGAILPLSIMKNREDSVRYKALTSYFFVSDSAQIDVQFIKRTVDNTKYLNLGITKDDIDHFMSNCFPVLKAHKTIILLFYLLLLFSGWGCNKSTGINIMIFNLFCWLIIIVIGLKLSMYNYFLLPWLSMTWGSSFWLVALQQKSVENWQKAIALVLLFIIAKVDLENLGNISRVEKEYNKQAYSYLKNITTLCRSRIPVLWDYDYLYLPSELFSRTESNILKDCVFQNMFFLAYYKFGQERCLEKFGVSPLEWGKVGVSFKNKSDKVCFVMEDRLATFLEEYYRTIYHLDFKLVKDVPANEVYPDNYLYHLVSTNPNDIDN